jgi:hypothetical protein
MNNIILIEDIVEFANSFKDEARSKNISITHKKSFEGLKQLLPRYHHQFTAVILDIKCLLTESQEKEDSNFIGAAMNYLSQNTPYFPRYILTGDDKEFEKFRSYYSNEKVFLKTPQGIKALFSELELAIADSEILKIKRENPKVFDLFQKNFYDSLAEETLLNILKRYNESNFSTFGGILRDIRALQEIIYKQINLKNRAVVPDNKFKPNGMIEFNDLMKHLNGNPDRYYNPTTTVYQNKAIYNLSNCLYWTSGEYIHATPTLSYEISTYSLKSLINSLLELFLWSERYLV